MKRTGYQCALLWLLVSTVLMAQSARPINFRGKVQLLQTYGPDRGSPIILSSGDLGWAGLVVHVAEFLAAQGYRVIGLNSRAYLASFTTTNSALDPRDVPGDYLALVEIARQHSDVKPILVGISEGAGLSVLAATRPEIKSAVQGILALGLPDQSELGWKWVDFTIWITKRAPTEPSFMVEDIIRNVSPVPLAEIHSTHDEFVPLDQAKAVFAHAGEPKRMWIIEAANHRFSDSRGELDRKLVESLRWIHEQAGTMPARNPQ